MPKNPEIPLPLYQILEEEFTSLHGQIPADEILIVELPGGAEGVPARRVEAARDWLFRGGHIKNPVGLASEILQFSDAAETQGAATTDAAAQDEWARKNLTEYLRKEIEQKALLSLVEKGGAQEVDAQKAIRDALNRLLKDSDLYNSDRFADNWLSAATKGLVKQRDAAGRFSGDALAHFNRLLLEEAFPNHIEKLRNIRLAAMYRRLHAVGQTALSLSGGGIRSGTFALGLLQGMAREDVLKEFDYLSTVSGGGYIGSWLTAWLHRHPDGLDGVTRDLKNDDPVSKIDPDPKPLQYLRNYSNFLTPKVGLLTADTWAFIGIYFRNLSLNWLVFIPLLMAAMMLPRLITTFTLFQPVKDEPVTVAAHIKEMEVRKLHPRETDEQIMTRVELLLKEDAGKKESEYKNLHPEVKNLEDISKGTQDLLAKDQEDSVKGLKNVPRELRVVYEPKPLAKSFFGSENKPENHFYWRHVLMLVGFAFGVWALAFISFNRPGLRELLRQRSRRWRERSDQRGFLMFCLLPLIISAACLTTYWAWSREVQTTAKSPTLFILFGLAFTFFGWLIASAILRRIFHWSEIKDNWAELFGLLFAGLLGGLLFWLVSFQEISDPVKSYGVLIRDRKVINSPFAWTDLTQWSWSSWTTEIYVCVGVPIFLLVFWGATTLFVGLSSYSRRIDDQDREWWARLGAWLLIASLAWATFNAIVIFGPIALLESPKLLATVGGLSGLISVLVGRSALTSAKEESDDKKGQTKSGLALGLLGSSLPVLGAIFLASFLALLSLATTGITRWIALEIDDVRVKPVEQTENEETAEKKSWGVELPSAVAELLTNVPENPKPIPAPSPAPSPGFAEYVEYITPVMRIAPTPTPQPTPTPSPEPTPCVANCLKPAELAAEREAEEKKKPDAFDGAKAVHMNVLHHTSLWLTLLLTLLLLGAGFLLARLINLNLFSLHGGYSNRLIRAFLGASRPSGSRRPNPFTGFDPADNIFMHELRPALLDEADITGAGRVRKLAESLLDENHPLSAYLLSKGRLETIESKREEVLAPTSGLVAALRSDLNEVLQDERLYALPDEEVNGERIRPAVWEFIEERLQSRRARVVLKNILVALGVLKPGDPAPAKLDARIVQKLSTTPMRSDYHILLNRLVLEGAYPRLIKPCGYPPPPYKLMHIINTTLNLVGGANLAWQQRKAEPFSISPLHSGCFRLGYRRSRDYGGPDGISIGTAAATSGAAASSNMGYYTTSPVISLLLTLFNVRLGWWLGNPGPAGNDTYKLAAPKFSVTPVVSEAFGLTDDRNPYVYLTDGGHFENLAVYEMALRRCRVIVVSDGAQDEDYHFSDLGNAVRKIRIDLGVPIDFPCVQIFNPDSDEKTKGKKGMYWAVGRIRYSCVDRVRSGDGPDALAPDKPTPNHPVPTPFEPAQDGILLYIKPAIYGDEPRDVLEYKKAFPAFPHQSTGDQFFDEPQFESYRALGSFIMQKLFSDEAQSSQSSQQPSQTQTGQTPAPPPTQPNLPPKELWRQRHARISEMLGRAASQWRESCRETPDEKQFMNLLDKEFVEFLGDWPGKS